MAAQRKQSGRVRDAGLRGQTTGSTGKASAARRATPPGLPGEKRVRPTPKTVPLAPAKPSRLPDFPTVPQAIDQREQFVGTDAMRVDQTSAGPAHEPSSSPTTPGKRRRG